MLHTSLAFKIFCDLQLVPLERPRVDGYVLRQPCSSPPETRPNFQQTRPPALRAWLRPSSKVFASWALHGLSPISLPDGLLTRHLPQCRRNVMETYFLNFPFRHTCLPDTPIPLPLRGCAQEDFGLRCGTFIFDLWEALAVYEQSMCNVTGSKVSAPVIAAAQFSTSREVWEEKRSTSTGEEAVASKPPSAFVATATQPARGGAPRITRFPRHAADGPLAHDARL